MRCSNSVSTLLLFGSAGFSLGMYEGPANPKMFSTLMFRSNMNPSKLERAVLFLNARNLVRRGQMFLAMSVPRNCPCGCSGIDNQKPFASEPAATLSMKVLSGLVIQYAATVLSEGSRVSLPDMLDCLMVWRFSPISPFGARFDGTQAFEGWHLIWMARFLTNSLPCSMPSSRKKQRPTML